MKFRIEHESGCRMRVHLMQNKMTYAEADTLLYYLQSCKEITHAKVYDRTADAAIIYTCDRQQIIALLQHFHYEKVQVPAGVIENSGRALNHQYEEKLIGRIVCRYASQWILPAPIRYLNVCIKAVRYLYEGVRTLLKGRLEVAVLDATAIGVSLFRANFGTAGSIMFMLGIGELLEEWTHKKSVDDLARTMSLNIGKVWLVTEDGQQIQVPVSAVRESDRVLVNMGNVIPFDGIVQSGEGMVNQASLTGESVSVRKAETDAVYAGTVLEEGELTIMVKQVGGASRFEKIVTMIEESEKLKSNVESQAEHLADKLVPFSLGGTILTYLLTRNVTKALSILMVDYSCALKLAMPVSVLSAIREAGANQITVKGGKFMEAVAAADTVVFDKTGTLTKAQPTVVDVYAFNGDSKEELLRIAACLEEHFPHSMAKAVVDAAAIRGLDHEEMHTKVEYVVAHGIVSSIQGKRTVIGSAHFVFEDEHCLVPADKQALFDALPQEYSHLYLAIDGMLAAVICVEDPLRKEAPLVVSALRKMGFTNLVMMTGDSERTAAAIAKQVGVDAYYAEVLPEDKAGYVERAKQAGHRVIMIGDGINDSPALSAADVGIAISDGAEIAREVADITISSDDLYQLVILRQLSILLMRRIHTNYHRIVGINSMLILLGVLGVIQPTTSALLHNSSTLLIGLDSMRNLLD